MALTVDPPNAVFVIALQFTEVVLLLESGMPERPPLRQTRSPPDRNIRSVFDGSRMNGLTNMYAAEPPGLVGSTRVNPVRFPDASRRIR
jgi:hypothetical protein